jgi:hypothetical protein
MSDWPAALEYELTRDDLYAFQWRAAFQSSRGRRIRRLTYVAWLVAIVLFAAVPAIGAGGFDVSRVSFTFILIAFPIVAILQWFIETRLMRRLILRLVGEEREGKGQLGKHRLALSEEGISESTAVNQSRTSWAGVHRVEQNAAYIFIYTSAAAAHMIPKRAFSNAAEAEAFYRLAQARTAAP